MAHRQDPRIVVHFAIKMSLRKHELQGREPRSLGKKLHDLFFVGLNLGFDFLQLLFKNSDPLRTSARFFREFLSFCFGTRRSTTTSSLPTQFANLSFDFAHALVLRRRLLQKLRVSFKTLIEQGAYGLSELRWVARCRLPRRHRRSRLPHSGVLCHLRKKIRKQRSCQLERADLGKHAPFPLDAHHRGIDILHITRERTQRGRREPSCLAHVRLELATKQKRRVGLFHQTRKNLLRHDRVLLFELTHLSLKTMLEPSLIDARAKVTEFPDQLGVRLLIVDEGIR